MTPNSFARVNLFMWLSKTCRIALTLKNFARVMRVHYQPKSINGDGAPVRVLHLRLSTNCS